MASSLKHLSIVIEALNYISEVESATENSIKIGRAHV